MKAILYHGPKDIRYEEIDPDNLNNGEILIKIKAAVTGGTDVKTYLNGHPRIIKSLPSTFGYEFAGEVEAVGPNYQSKTLTKIEKGMRVVAANTAPCYECFFCNKEEFSLCENLDFLNGSFAEYIKIPASIVKHNLYELPDNLSFDEATMLQTLAVCLHGFARSNIKAADTVAVYGLGAIGQTFIKILRAFDENYKIIALGRSEKKLKLAKENGADYVIDLKNIEEFKKIAVHGADVVVEAVGKTEAWQAALGLVRRGGLINFFGGCPRGTSIEIDTFKLHYDELRIIGVFHHTPKYIKAALDLLANKKIDMKNLISHEMKLEDLRAALELMLSGEAMKVLIRN